jgi:hypothetical protein
LNTNASTLKLNENYQSNGTHQTTLHTISKFLSNNTDELSTSSTLNYSHPTPPHSSSTTTTTTTTTSSNPFSISKICSTNDNVASSQAPTTTAATATNPLNKFQNQTNPAAVAALYPLYHLFNPKNYIQQQQNIFGQSQNENVSVSNQLKDSEKDEDEEDTVAEDVDEVDEDESDEDENYEEDENETYGDDENIGEDETNKTNESKQQQQQHSSSAVNKTKKQDNLKQLGSALGSTGSSSNIKIEQNEKMIKKNKVIELYSKGERCVRKLSQLTGVPLTTVYRVIGKLKGINYNIPRGNGAGRKTILDAQDREILVEILNVQPRISRKALGKELEKRTGKSIHNSTLNRELCRLRHHGHNFAAVHAVAGNSFINSKDTNNSMSSLLVIDTKNQNQNYLKHFNNTRKNISNSSSSTSPPGLPNNTVPKQIVKQNLGKTTTEKSKFKMGKIDQVCLSF